MAKINITQILSAIVVMLVLSTGIYTWAIGRDYTTLKVDGDTLARSRWYIEMERTYSNIKYSYQKDNCLEIGGRLTDTRCYYPDDFYERKSRSIPSIKIYNISNSVYKEMYFYKYGTRGERVGPLVERMTFEDTEDIEQFPVSYNVNFNPKDNTNYKLVWQIDKLKDINLPDGKYNDCVYDFGKMHIGLEYECDNIEYVLIENDKDRVLVYFKPTVGMQSLDVTLVDPEVCSGSLLYSCASYTTSEECSDNHDPCYWYGGDNPGCYGSAMVCEGYPSEGECVGAGYTTDYSVNFGILGYDCTWDGGWCYGDICTLDDPGTPVDDCFIFTEDNTKYTLTEDISNAAATICLDVRASNITIDCDGHTIDGTDKSSSKGVFFNTNENNVTVKNCIFNDWYYGIDGATNDYIEINNVTVTSSGYMPLYLRYQDHPRLYNSTFIGNSNYVYYYFMNNGIFSGNTISTSTYGLICYGSSNGLYKNNTYDGNNITSNYPLYTYHMYDSIYKNNYFYPTTALMYGSSGNTLHNVSFYNNYIECRGSKCIYLNGVYTAEPTVFNTTPTETLNIMGGAWSGGNYWTNPSKTGYSDKCADADENGLCDEPYLIPNTASTVYYDYEPISNVTITFSQSFSSPANDTYVGPYPQIIVNVRANVGWKNSTIYYKNSTIDWTEMTDCSNTSINGLVNINYKCIWNNTNLTEEEPGYDVMVVSYDASDNQINSTNHYYIDLTLPQTAYVESDFPEYPYSRFRPEVSDEYTIENTLTKLTDDNSDIQAYYNFDTDSTIVQDKINDNNGTLEAGASISTIGKYGKSLSLDGINDYVDIGNSTDFDFTNSMSLSAYVKTTEEGYVIAKDPEGGYVYRNVQGNMLGTQNSWTYYMGYSFYADNGGTITELCGRFVGTKTVQLQNYQYGVVASASVVGAGVTTWSCTEITPFNLNEGQQYYIGTNINGAYGTYDTFTSNGRESLGTRIMSSNYQYNAAQFSLSKNSVTNYMYGIVDFKISYGKGSDYPYYISTHHNGTFGIQSGGTEYEITSSVDITDDEWHLITATYETGNMSLYIDGTLVNSTDAFSGDLTTNELPVWIGRSYNPSDTTGFFDGNIDEVMLLNKTLTSAEVLELNNSLYTRFNTEEEKTFTKNITVGGDLEKVTTYFNNYEDSSVNLSLGYYTDSWSYLDSVEITSGIIQEFTIPTTSTNISLNYTLISDGFYTPEIYGNITLTSASTSSERQTSIRNGQTLVLRVNASDSTTGIDYVQVNLANINNSENVTMTLQSGSKDAGEWGYFNITIPNVNNTEGYKNAPVYAWDNVANMGGSDTFAVFFDNTPTDINYITNLSTTYPQVGGEVSISWSVSDESPLSPNGYYILSNNISATWNNDTQGYLNEDGNGEATFTDLEIGVYSYQLTTYDDAGNSNTTELYTFEVTDSAPTEIVIIYPNNNSNFSDRNQSIGFQALNLEADNCSLFNNNELIQLRNDTNESHTDYWFNYSIFDYGQNILRVDCLKDEVTYSSDDVYMNMIKYQLGIELLEPTSNFSIVEDYSFNWSVNVTCTIMNCSVINVTLNYDENNFSIAEDKMQNFTLLVNESVIVNWTVTADGSIGTDYEMSAQVKQEDYDGGLEDYENITETIYIDITINTCDCPTNKEETNFLNDLTNCNVTSNDTTTCAVNLTDYSGVTSAVMDVTGLTNGNNVSYVSNFSILAQDGFIQGVYPTNSHIYVVGVVTDKVYEYDLDGIYTGFNISYGSEMVEARWITIIDNNFYIQATNPMGYIYVYNLTGDYIGIVYNATGIGAGDIYGICYDGTNRYVLDKGNDDIYRVDDNWNVSDWNFDISSQTSSAKGFDCDSSYFYVLGSDTVYKYNSSGDYIGEVFSTGRSTYTAGIGIYNDIYYTGDWDYDIILKYQATDYLTYPSINIGIDNIWNYTGNFSTTETVSDFSSYLTPGEINYFNITADSWGSLTLDGLNVTGIVYSNWTINMDDNCIIQDYCDLGTGEVIWNGTSGTGTAHFNNTLLTTGFPDPYGYGTPYIDSNGLIYIN